MSGAVQRLSLLNEAGEPRLTPTLATRLVAALASPGRVVAVEGGDGTFCEGFELGLLSETAEAGAGFRKLMETIDATPGPVIALVDGPALGGGCAIAAVADVVLATPRATFGLPEALWGLIPAVALPYVERRVSRARARLLALGIAAIDATEAHRWGLVDAIVPDLESGLGAWVKRLGRADVRAIAEVKKLTRPLPERARERAADDSFATLGKSPATCRRVAKLLSGGVPWGEDE